MMVSTKILRYSLWASFPFNLVAAVILVLPGSGVGQFAGLPTDVPVLYTATLAFLVCLFGFAYAWLAMQPEIDRPLLTVSAIGQAGVFLIALVLWLLDLGSGRMTFVASADLAFAVLWISWLASTNPRAAVADNP